MKQTGVLVGLKARAKKITKMKEQLSLREAEIKSEKNLIYMKYAAMSEQLNLKSTNKKCSLEDQIDAF